MSHVAYLSIPCLFRKKHIPLKDDTDRLEAASIKQSATELTGECMIEIYLIMTMPTVLTSLRLRFTVEASMGSQTMRSPLSSVSDFHLIK